MNNLHEPCGCYYCDKADDKLNALTRALINSNEWIRTHANYKDELVELILMGNKMALSAEEEDN